MAQNVEKDVEKRLQKYMQDRQNSSEILEDREFLECLVTVYLQLEINLCGALLDEFFSKLPSVLLRFKRFNASIDLRELKGSLKKQAKQLLLEMNERQMEKADVMGAEPVAETVSETVPEKIPENTPETVTESVPIPIKVEVNNDDPIETELESFLRSKDTKVPENLMKKSFLSQVLKEYLNIKVSHLTGDQRGKAYNEVHWNMRAFKECVKRRNIPFAVLKVEWLKEYLRRRINRAISRIVSGEVVPQGNDGELLQVKQELIDENLASEAKNQEIVEEQTTETPENNPPMDIDETINDQNIAPDPQNTLEEDEIPLEHRKKPRSRSKYISFDFTPSEEAHFKTCSLKKGSGRAIYDHLYISKDAQKYILNGSPAERSSRATLQLTELPYWPDVGIKLVLPDFTITRYCASNKKYKLFEPNYVKIDNERNSSEFFKHDTSKTSNRVFSGALICSYINSMLECLEYSEYVSRGQIKYILEKMLEDFSQLVTCTENVSYSYFLNDFKYYRVFEQKDVETSKSEIVLNLCETFNPEIVFSIKRTNEETEIDKDKISVYFKELLERMKEGEEEVFDTMIPEGYFLYCVGCRKDGNSPLGRFNTKRIAYLSEHLGPHCVEEFKCVNCNFSGDIPALAIQNWKHSCDKFT
ncbi:uncharacterized protein LOC134836988 isoform X2 [Culicoides brevitarsis]|uniref:uncharacterized protein LOC134836988 isoform X2 n=1 Tax=Culicoides brevitarsis TaxID=469753 RepID=UPI00307CAB19